MARTYNGSIRSVASWNGTLSGYPVSMFCRGQSANTTASATVLQYSINPAANDRNLSLLFRGDVVGDPVQWRRGNDAATTTAANSAGAYTASTWTAIGGSGTSASAVSVFRDGVETTNTSTTTFPPVISPEIVVGAFRTGTPSFTYSDFLNGAAADLAMWNGGPLTARQQASLSKGFRAPMVQRSGLQMWLPLIGSVFADLCGKAGTFADTGGTPGNTRHPRSYGWC